MPTSCWVYENKLADFVRLRASLPRTTKDKPAYCCTPIINGKKFFSRTPKCYSWQRWACDPEDSKSKPMVLAWERQADGKPSLVVSRGHVSWTMLSLIALTKQNQLAKSWQAASQPVSQRKACLFQDCFSCRNSRSAETFSDFFWQWVGNGPARNNSQNWNFVFFRTSTCFVGNMPSTDVSRKESKRIMSLIVWNAIGQEILANFIVK